MENCNCENMKICKYICSKNDYRVTDENNDLINIILEHDIIQDENDEELNSIHTVKYCDCCNCVFDFPVDYNQSEKKFKTKEYNTIEYYDNYLNDNIIHEFDIKCEKCNSEMNKCTFTIESIQETKENLDNLSMPNDFIKDLIIFDEKNKIEQITPENYDIYKHLILYNTEKSKNILFCKNCNFIIFNDLMTYDIIKNQTI
jgi:hypothetical protein